MSAAAAWTPDANDKAMLALASISYSGFLHASEAAVADRLWPWLKRIKSEGLGTWAPAWGPACFRVPTSLVDDAMAFAVEDRSRRPGQPPRYAIVVRGTNPLSCFDWIFGDLWVDHSVDWPGVKGAKLSASTALGLEILERITATVPPSPGSSLADVANDLASALAGALADTPVPLPELTSETLLTASLSQRRPALLRRIAAQTGRQGNALRDAVANRIGDHLAAVGSPLRAAVKKRAYDALVERIDALKDPGQTLLEFVATLPKDACIAVTGHSKGGALAIALAARLAKIRGAEGISCFSFAGPTAGNAGFAKHYEKLLGSTTRSIANPFDIVPQAWESEGLRTIGKRHRQLALATRSLARRVAPLGHAHVQERIWIPAPTGRRRSLFAEIVHQHLDAYLEAFGFSAGWNVRSIFFS